MLVVNRMELNDTLRFLVWMAGPWVMRREDEGVTGLGWDYPFAPVMRLGSLLFFRERRTPEFVEVDSVFDCDPVVREGTRQFAHKHDGTDS